LRQLKARYDPDNVFNQNFAIPPATDISHQEAAPAQPATFTGSLF
jgi:Berberine and berberine like